MLEQVGDKGAGLLLIPARLAQGVGPGGKVGVATVSGGLGIGHDHFNAVLEQVGPVVDTLGVALAHDEYRGRGEGCAAIG